MWYVGIEHFADKGEQNGIPKTKPFLLDKHELAFIFVYFSKKDRSMLNKLTTIYFVGKQGTNQNNNETQYKQNNDYLGTYQTCPNIDKMQPNYYVIGRHTVHVSRSRVFGAKNDSLPTSDK